MKCKHRRCFLPNHKALARRDKQAVREAVLAFSAFKLGHKEIK